MIPAQADDGPGESERFYRFVKKLLAVPKKAMDRQQKRKAEKGKARKVG